MFIRTLLLLVVVGASGNGRPPVVFPERPQSTPRPPVGLNEPAETPRMPADVRHHESYKKWLLALQDGPDDQRLQAAVELGELDLDSLPMLSVLRVGLVKAENEETAVAIVQVLRKFGLDAKPALPEVLISLHDGILGLEEAITFAEAIGEPGHPDIIRYFFRPPEPLFLQEIERNDAPLGVLIEIARRAPNKVLPPVLAQLQRHDINAEDVLLVLEDLLLDERREQTPGDAQYHTLEERLPWFLPETRTAIVRALRPLLATPDMDQRQFIMELLFVVQPALLDELFPAYFTLLLREDSLSPDTPLERLIAFHAFRPLVAKLASGCRESEERAFVLLRSLGLESSDWSLESTQLGRRLLLQAIEHPSARVRFNIMEALEPGLPYEPSIQAAFFRRLHDTDINNRIAAARTLLNARLANADVQRAFAAIAANTANTQELRLDAIACLSRMKIDARPAVPHLLRLCKAPNPELRLAATQALAQIDPATSASLLPALKQDIATNNGGDWETYMALATLGPRATSLVPVLEENWKDADNDERITLAHALIEIDVGNQAKYLAYLRQQLRETHFDGALSIARSLQILGPKAKAALPELARLLRQADNPRDENLTIAVACLHLDPRHAPSLRVVRLHLENGNTGVVDTVVSLVKHGVKLVPELLKMAQNHERGPEARLHALQAMHRLGRDAKSALPKLEALPADDELQPYVLRTIKHLRACE